MSTDFNFLSCKVLTVYFNKAQAIMLFSVLDERAHLIKAAHCRKKVFFLPKNW